VLGGLLQDNGAWDRVGDILTDSDFYRYEHQLIFGAIGRLINALKPADVVTVYEQLQRDGKHEEVGGLAYLNSLAQYVPSAANIRRYAEIVRERSILRKLITAATTPRPAPSIPASARWKRCWTSAPSACWRSSPDVRGDDWEAMDTGIVRLLDASSRRPTAPSSRTSSPRAWPTWTSAWMAAAGPAR
jgi:replicative DNA helicase